MGAQWVGGSEHVEKNVKWEKAGFGLFGKEYIKCRKQFETRLYHGDLDHTNEKKRHFKQVVI
jgi:hypothetical protein